MPSVHIPEDVAEPYILEHGGYEGAKEAMVDVLRENTPGEGA